MPPSLDPTFQAHEVVYCSKCALPYDTTVNITQSEIPKDAETRKWFLAKCSHALCGACLFPNGVPDSVDDTDLFQCPTCQEKVQVMVLSYELPSDILPYFRPIEEMSEELFGAIKFQHRNLLNLVDILRNKNIAMADAIRQLLLKIKESEDDKRTIERLRERVGELERRLGDRNAMPPPQKTISPGTGTGFVTPARGRGIGNSKEPFRLAGSTSSVSREANKQKLFLQSSTPNKISNAQQQTELSPPVYGSVLHQTVDYSRHEQRRMSYDSGHQPEYDMDYRPTYPLQQQHQPQPFQTPGHQGYQDHSYQGHSSQIYSQRSPYTSPRHNNPPPIPIVSQRSTRMPPSSSMHNRPPLVRPTRTGASSAIVTASGGYGARPIGTPIKGTYSGTWGDSSSCGRGTSGSPVRDQSGGGGVFVSGLRNYSRRG